VGIGASAGGLEALDAFFDHVPEHPGVAFVVVQHLSPDYKSMMAELLGKRTSLPVVQAENGQRVLPDHVYLIPPKKHLTIFQGQLILTEKDDRRLGVSFPIDIFLLSLAQDVGDRAIAVILSGTGSDGMRGVRAVKEAGGAVVAQQEDTARFDGMPRSAIATGLVDLILPPEDMPEQILSYARHPELQEIGLTSDPSRQLDGLARILSLLRDSFSIDFSHYRSSTVHRRIERRLRINRLQTLDEYCRLLERSSTELGTLYKDLLIGVTSFFRDTDAFESIQTQVIPEIVSSAEPGAPIRAWVVGCSTGEEAYSLAMLFHEHMERTQTAIDVKIFATDVDKESIEIAAAGSFPESIAADLPTERLNRFFLKRDDRYHVVRQIREMVIFAHQNILRDPPFTRINLISCRNLLIYFEPEVQQRVLSLFAFGLREGGYLLLGSSETVGELKDEFKRADERGKIYRRTNVTATAPASGFNLQRSGDPLRTQIVGHMPTRGHQPTRTDDTLLQTITEEYVPPGLAINESGEPIHIFGDVSRYLAIPPGRAVFNVQKMAHPDISVILSTAISKVRKDGRPVLYEGLKMRDGDERTQLSLRVRRLPGRSEDPRGYLIFFEEEGPPPSETGGEPEESLDYRSEQRIKDLEQELQFTRESLQATIEELETSNEELQSTNEELIASNEELQSTNEELQSVNEELYTLNTEYQSKIQELAEINNDLDNLLEHTRIATLFLDRNLRIRKYTKSAIKLLKLVQHDVGRSIRDLSLGIACADLIERVGSVLETGEPQEEKVHAEDGALLQMRVLPYRTHSGAVDGVLLSFVANIEAASQDVQAS
jgi:two-component system CheB/CheR fusion protein